MANTDYYTQDGDVENAAFEFGEAASGSGNAYTIVGKWDFGSGQASGKGAHRFPGINLNLNQDVISASLILKANFVVQSGTLRMRTNGIKESNTSPFTSSPFGRPMTTAQADNNTSVPSVGNTITISVTSMVNEITHVSGWGVGHAMAFVVGNNGSDDDSWYEDDNLQSKLVIETSALPDFTPAPISIAAPTFPSLSSYGIKVSQPGVNVQDAIESELYFTTRKKQLRVAIEEEILNVFTKAHTLGYAPCVLAYFNDTGKKYLMNRQIGPIEVGNYVASNAANVIFSNNTGVSIYYYMFIDPLT